MQVKIGTWDIEAIAVNNSNNKSEVLLGFNKHLKDLFMRIEDPIDNEQVTYGGNELKDCQTDGKTFILLEF